MTAHNAPLRLTLVLLLLGGACGTTETRTAEMTSTTTLAEMTSKTTPSEMPRIVPSSTSSQDVVVRTGAEIAASSDFVEWRGSRIGLIGHRVSRVGEEHLADIMARSSNVELVALFGPEHGIRSEADAGEDVVDSIDPVTGVPVHSLYGETRVPTLSMLEDIDVLFYDLQDVGARYYTYISTMGLAMQSAAAHGVTFVVLDRPNPLGNAARGGMLHPGQRSFVGQYPIPALYGLTPGELATAIVGEGWLDGLENLRLEVVELSGWTGTMRWVDTGLDWLPPSPAISSFDTALLYPATVLFEATTLSYGRGTGAPFEVIGAPWIDGEALASRLSDLELSGVAFESIEFTPADSPRFVTPPGFVDQQIEGVWIRITDHRSVEPIELGLQLLDAVIAESPGEELLSRPEWLDRLTGSTRLRTTLETGGAAADLLPEFRVESNEFSALISGYRRY